MGGTWTILRGSRILPPTLTRRGVGSDGGGNTGVTFEPTLRSDSTPAPVLTPGPSTSAPSTGRDGATGASSPISLGASMGAAGRGAGCAAVDGAGGAGG